MPLQFRSTASRAPTRDARSRPAKARPTNSQPRRNCATLRSFASSLLGPSGRLTAAGDRHLGITRKCHERVADTGSGKAFWNGAHRASVCSVGAGNTDALAAVEKRVDAPNEMPELLVELSDGTLRGLGLSRGDVASTPSRKRVHPSEATPRAADKVFFARGFRNAHPLSSRYRETALAVLQKCLPVRPTPEFGAIVHDTVLHLRLVIDAPFPSRNLGPWVARLREQGRLRAPASSRNGPTRISRASTSATSGG